MGRTFARVGRWDVENALQRHLGSTAPWHKTHWRAVPAAIQGAASILSALRMSAQGDQVVLVSHYLLVRCSIGYGIYHSYATIWLLLPCLRLSARYCFSCQKCEDYFTVKGRSARESQCLSGLRLFLDYC